MSPQHPTGHPARRPGRVIERVSERELTTINGNRIRVPDPDYLVHLQFRRFAGCPVCNLHLRSIAQRHEEIVAADITEVVFFHSTAEELRHHDFPFAVVADPGKRYYREFGVESGPRALLDPRVWCPALSPRTRSPRARPRRPAVPGAHPSRPGR